MGDPRLTASEARAQDSDFVAQCSLEGLRHRLPLLWPVSDGVPPSPKVSYRSHYVYRGWQDLEDPANWNHLTDFDLMLRLIDFSPLRDVLAQRLGWTSARGHVPFDPVSIFLLIGWRIVNGWSRSDLLKKIHDPRYADYAYIFGFEDSVFPTEGGLRYWLTALGRHSQNGDTVTVQVDEERLMEIALEYLNDLVAQSVALLLDAGFITPEAWEEALICPDGMIHDAASRLNCARPPPAPSPTPVTSPRRPTIHALARPKRRAYAGVIATPSTVPRSATEPRPAIPRPASSVTAAPTNPIQRTRTGMPMEETPAMGMPVSPSSSPIPRAASTSSWLTTSPLPAPVKRSPLLLNSSNFPRSIPPSTSRTSPVMPPSAIPLSCASSVRTSTPAG